MSLTEDFKKTISEKIKSDNNNINYLINKVIVPILTEISGVKDYEKYSETHLKGLYVVKKEDLDEIFNRLGFDTRILLNSFPDKNKRYMIVSNHPTGPLEGLFVQRVFHTLDIPGKLIGDDIMGNFEQMKDCYLGLSIRVDGKSRLAQIRKIKKEVSNGINLAIFPSGSVSKFSFKNGRPSEFKWDKGFIDLAKSNNLDILPIHIKANLSPLHYLLKSHDKLQDLSSLRLFKESLLFVENNKNQKIDICIGDPISIDSIVSDEKSAKHIQNICESLIFKSYSIIK